jgi:hypothetical protein
MEVIMEKKELLIQRLEEIGNSLKDSKNALALLALGSCGLEQERMDEYSDLDFFAIVKNGYKQKYINELDWLKTVAPVEYYFKNTVDGYKLIFSDGVFCEFAVFEGDELQSIPFSEGKIIWSADDFNKSICEPKIIEKSQKEKNVDWLIGEIITNIYVGLGRYRRGEKLSAYKLIQYHAFERIIELLPKLEQGKEIISDIFNRDRRIENKYPKTSVRFCEFIQGYDRTPESAKAMLEFLDQYFEINKYIKDKIIELL